MAPVAGPSTGSSAERAPRTNLTRVSARSKTNKRIDQETILNHLLGVFMEESSPSLSSKAAQKARAVHLIDKDSWSPADKDEVAAALHGLSLKHSIHLDYELATALQRCYSQLIVSCERSAQLAEQSRKVEIRRGSRLNVTPPLIRPDNVSDAVRFLLQLSKPADITARTAANLMLNATHSSRSQYVTAEQRKNAERREWLSILVQEPLQGDAWVVEGQDDSDLSDWSLDSDDERRLRMEQGYDSDKEPRKQRDRLAAVSASMHPSPSLLQDFQQRKLWSEQRRSRLAALAKAKEKSLHDGALQATNRALQLSEADIVRESLSSLMGSSSMLYSRHSSGQFTIDNSRKDPLTNSLTEQMEAVAYLASTLSILRSFVKATVFQSIHTVDALTRTPAVEAFAEQLQALLENLCSQFSELDADIAAGSTLAHPAVIRTNRYTTLTQLINFSYSKAASVLLLARLLKDMGFISGHGGDTDVSLIPRGSSDRALIDGLQALLAFVHQQDELAHGDMILTDLSTCLLAACRPAWRSVCHLLQRGLSFAIHRDHDLLFDDRLVQHMIRHDASISTSDSAFWTSGYVVNQPSIDEVDNMVNPGYSSPAFLQSIMQDVLTTAKGVGLLRSLGVDALGGVQPDPNLGHVLGLRTTIAQTSLNPLQSLVERGADDPINTEAEAGHEEIVAALCFTPEVATENLRRLLFARGTQLAEQTETKTYVEDVLPQTPISRPDTEPLWDVSITRNHRHLSHRLLEPLLGRLLQEHLSPISALVRKRVTEVLLSPVTEGGYALQSHVQACHGLFFMRRGAEMASWLESLFMDLDRRNGMLRATNHHRLHSGFNDALEIHQQSNGGEAWIDVNLVRFYTVNDDMDRAAAIRQRSRIHRLADVKVEYEVPWPLTFVFPTGCMRFYQYIFSTLLQANYAQWKLASTLKLAKPETMHMRKFWSLRRQAQWLVRTLIGFIQSDILFDGSQRILSALEGTRSIDSAIQVHTEALERMELLCFHRLDQAKVKELFSAAWRIGTEVVNNYERFIGTSTQEEDRLARRKRRERRKKRRDKAKREGAPLGAIAEEDEEEEEEDGEEQQEEEQEPIGNVRDHDDFERVAVGDMDGEATLFGHTDVSEAISTDASMSADISANWIESETHKRESFRLECERQRKALNRLVEELKVGVDDQIGRIAARSAVQAQDATQADRVLQEHDHARAKWQGLLDALAWSDMGY